MSRRRGLLESAAMTELATLPALRLDRSRQAAPQVFEALRELIVSVTLEPGTVLARAELAEHYGVSQTPIRDALTRLGEEGLVDIFPQHATVVSRIDTGAALQAHFLRRAIELEILVTVCGLPEPAHAALMDRLEALLAQQKAAVRRTDFNALAAADQSFHQALYEAAGVPALWDLVRQRSGHVDRLRRLNLPARGKAQAIVADHESIVTALRQRDAAGACQALRKHLAGTLSFVDKVRQEYPDWMA